MPQVRILCKQIWPHNVVTKILQTLYIQNTLCVSEHRCEKQHHTINFCQVHSSFFTPQMLFSVSSHLVLTCLYFHRGVSPLPSRKINSVFLPPPPAAQQPTVISCEPWQGSAQAAKSSLIQRRNLAGRERSKVNWPRHSNRH